ncbi:hypothetical protein HF086_001148 [Spodoptera exigua]|uniref:Splicing factor Cactin C-terminal domain-containing protein n=1 Tax=Spodoptera exigua TaxID=7107 RepID=A0A922M1G3_SPOEX|nr:hypothetical protein HF086_001148 [Spodoptera exigua]
MSRARLRDRHQTNLRRKLQLLKQEQGVQPAQPAQPDQPDQPSQPSQPSQPAQPSQPDGQADAPAAPEGPEQRGASPARSVDGDAEWGSAACVALYVAGRYSPAPLEPAALEPATLLTEPAHDAQRLAYLRARLRPAPAAAPDPLEREARRAMAAVAADADEAQFSVEHALPEQPCLWADKYRPRKPRYFNRVHTGFEWNKYNQTHYDMDNPPPKIVQGYKFNIFYPDLIDKNATPEFSLKPCPENPDFAVLRFHAGPPYEDIAFKIVNREWEYSYKRGFRCHFHNNIFQLWFHFKRYRYRR